jgi:hypothetical protein
VGSAVSRRSRWIAALLLVPAALALIHYVQVWAATPTPLARTSDFAGTYVAATLWRTGHGVDMYNEAAEQQVMAATGAPANHLYIPFENPPAAALLAVPLTPLNAADAYRVWSIAQLLLLIAAVWIAARAAPWPARTPRLMKFAISGFALAGFGTGLLFVEGQWDGISALGIAAGYAYWRRGDGGRAGLVVAVTAAIAKPHLALGVAAFMLGRRDWRALAGAVAGVIAVFAACLLAVGTSGVAAFIAALLKPANSPIAQMQGASGLFGSLIGVTTSAYTLAIFAGFLAALVAAWLGAISRTRADLLEPALGGAVVLSLFASPHLLGHDLTLLAPPLVFVFAWFYRADVATPALVNSSRPGRGTLATLVGWVALSLATMLDLGYNTVGPPGRLTPWVLLLLAAGCVFVATSAPRRRAPSPVMHVAHHAAGVYRP